jgi:hypothetical protein
MIVTPELARYLIAIIQAVVFEGRTDIPLTNTCPECGVDLQDDDADIEHLIITLTSDTTAVVVGCEGYFVINPNLVGIDAPNWTADGALGDEVTGVHDAACNGNHP